ncbi:hypothetical protein OAL43_00800 [bacterium]|nr:hypothetical protein [bacterium]
MTFSVVIAAVLGIISGWSVFVLHRGGKWLRCLSKVILSLHVMAAVFPMVLHAAAWESTAGKFGWAIMTQTGTRTIAGAPYASFGGLLASGWIHGLIGTSIVCLATFLGTNRIPQVITDDGSLRMSPLARWWKLRFPLAAPWWMTALVATAMLAATEMTVADLYGFRTLADEFYLLYAAEPTLTSVIQTCVLPLILFGVGSVWLSIAWKRLIPLQSIRLNHNEQSGEPFSSRIQILATIVSLSTAAMVTAIPGSSMVVKLGQVIELQQGSVSTTWKLNTLLHRLLEAPTLFADEYYWTIVIAVVTATASIVIAWPLAAWGRMHPKIGKTIDFLTLAIAIIPGPVVAIWVVYFFQLQIPGFADLYERSVLPTVLALQARSLPIVYWVLRSGYSSMQKELLESAALEIPWTRRLFRIDRILLRRNLRIAWLVSAVVASGDIAATLPVIPPGMTTVGTRLFGLLHSGARYQEAALAFWYIIAIISAFLFVLLSEKHRPSNTRVV